MNRLLTILLITTSVSIFAQEGNVNKYLGNGWEISIAEGWQSEDEDNLVTIYDPSGYGALQISSYSKNTAVSEDDLKELASEHIESGAKYKTYEQNGGSVLTLAFGYEGIFWQYWYVSVGNLAILVTYNCKEADQPNEIDVVKSIVATINAT